MVHDWHSWILIIPISAGSLCLVALIIACILLMISNCAVSGQSTFYFWSLNERLKISTYRGHAGTDIYLCGDPKRCPVCLGPGIRYPVNIHRDTGPGVTWPVYVPTLHTIHCQPVLCIHCVHSALLKLQTLSTNCPNTWNTRNCRNGYVQ